jgi:RNase adapter protein RapZ
MTDKFKPRLVPIVLITGPSGAGRSTSIRVLEDLNFEAIDNLPLRLIPKLLDGPEPLRPLALGIDPRNRDFSTTALIQLIEHLEQRSDSDLTVLYLDCRPDVLLRRFSETRRRHPLAPSESPEIGVQRELELLTSVRHRADLLVDTSDLNIHQLRTEIERWFKPRVGNTLALSVHSFSYKRGLPRGMDMVFDCRFLINPHWQPNLRELDGRDPEVAKHVATDLRFTPFFDRVLDLTRFLLPAYVDEGKSHLSIAFGCTGGKHRSVALTQALAKALADDGQQVSVRHRELERRGTDERPN